MAFEQCYKAGFDQYYKWLAANHPDDAKQWNKKQQELQKRGTTKRRAKIQYVLATKSEHKEFQGLGYSPEKNA